MEIFWCLGQKESPIFAHFFFWQSKIRLSISPRSPVSHWRLCTALNAGQGSTRCTHKKIRWPNSRTRIVEPARWWRRPCVHVLNSNRSNALLSVFFFFFTTTHLPLHIAYGLPPFSLSRTVLAHRIVVVFFGHNAKHTWAHTPAYTFPHTRTIHRIAPANCSDPI